MIGQILALALVVLVIAVQLWFFDTYFPRLFVLWRAMIIATIVLGVIRALKAWLCGLLCG